MEQALLGNDTADQEGNQDHDRYCVPAHLLQVMHHRGEPEFRRMPPDAEPGRDHGTNHIDQRDEGFPDAIDIAADAIEHGSQGATACR